MKIKVEVGRFRTHFSSSSYCSRLQTILCTTSMHANINREQYQDHRYSFHPLYITSAKLQDQLHPLPPPPHCPQPCHRRQLLPFVRLLVAQTTDLG